jgi:Tubulin-tyrosine ligase family
VLQAEIRPCLLIRDRRKFHIRSYVIGVERLKRDDFVDTFLYRKHEVRIAGEPVSMEQNDDRRNKAAHVTNSAQEIELLENIPELANLQDQLELFIAQIFAKHLIEDISRRVAMSSQEDPNCQADKFVIAGLDIMVTEDKRLYLLEVNVNPTIPPPETVSTDVSSHLVQFMKDLVDLVVGNRTTNFVSGTAVATNHTS